MREEVRLLFKSMEKLVIVLALVLFSFAFFPLLGKYNDLFNKLSFYCWIVVYVTVFFLVLRSLKEFKTGAKKVIWAWLMVMISGLSVFWSYSPDTTIRRFADLLVVTMFAVYLASRYSLVEILKYEAWAMVLIMFFSIVFAIFLPEYGVDHEYHPGAWQGVFVQKNLLGRMMVFSSLVFLILNRSIHGKKSMLAILGFLLSVSLILLSTSKTALLVFLAMLVLFPLSKIFRFSYKLATPIFIFFIILTAIATIGFIENAEAIFSFLGRDITLSGRTLLWQAAIFMIKQKPLLGYGLGGFWLGTDGPSAIMQDVIQWMPAHSHNGLIDLALDLGLVGLSLFVVPFLRNLIFAIDYLQKLDDPEKIWPFVYLMFMFFYNVTESTILNPNAQIFWVTYVATCCSTRLSLDRLLEGEMNEGGRMRNDIHETGRLEKIACRSQ